MTEKPFRMGCGVQQQRLHVSIPLRCFDTGQPFYPAGGMVVGGVVLMMLAPKSRKEMCSNIKRKMEDAKEYVDEAMKNCHFHSCDCAESQSEKSETAALKE